MAVHRCPFKAMCPAECLVAAGTVTIAGTGTIGRRTAHTFHMVMMAFLRRTNLRFEAEHLISIFAHLTVHHRRAFMDLPDPVFQRFEHQPVIVEIGCLDEFDVAFLERLK